LWVDDHLLMRDGIAAVIRNGRCREMREMRDKITPD
jgi:hypothetical protein